MVYLNRREQSLYPLFVAAPSRSLNWASNKALDFFYSLHVETKGETTKVIVDNHQRNNTFSSLHECLSIHTTTTWAKTGKISNSLVTSHFQVIQVVVLLLQNQKIKTCLQHEPYFSATAFLPLISVACSEARCGLPSDFPTRTASFLTTSWWTLQLNVSESESSQSTPGPYTGAGGFAYHSRSQFTALAAASALPLL